MVIQHGILMSMMSIALVHISVTSNVQAALPHTHTAVLVFTTPTDGCQCPMTAALLQQHNALITMQWMLHLTKLCRMQSRLCVSDERGNSHIKRASSLCNWVCRHLWRYISWCCYWMMMMVVRGWHSMCWDVSRLGVTQDDDPGVDDTYSA